MTFRADLPIEADTVFDSAGKYVSDWVETAEISAVTPVWVASGSGPYVNVDYSIDGVTVMTQSGAVSGVAVAVPVRYFRISATNGAPGAAFRLSVRVTN
jgi:hypothetical protein